MPRIRTIKPEFFTHPDNAALSIPARLLFVSLWTQADDEGRLRDQPRVIGALAFGDHDKVNPDKLLNELADAPDPRICRYEVDGKRYIEVTNFTKHQVINRPRASVFPPVPLTDDSVNAHGALPGGSGSGMEVEQGMEGDGDLTPTDTLLKYLRKFQNTERSFTRFSARQVLEIAAEEGVDGEQAGRFLADVWDWWQAAPVSKRWKRPTRGWRTWCRREAERIRFQLLQDSNGKPLVVAPPPPLTREERMAKREASWQVDDFEVSVP